MWHGGLRIRGSYHSRHRNNNRANHQSFEDLSGTILFFFTFTCFLSSVFHNSDWLDWPQLISTLCYYFLNPIRCSLHIIAAQRPAPEERVGCRARHSGGINTWSHIRFCSDAEPFTDGRRTQRLLFYFFQIEKRIYLHSCLSTWLQQRSVEVISSVRRLLECWLLTGAGGKMYFMNVKLQRG